MNPPEPPSGTIKVTLQLTEAQAGRIRSFWDHERMMLNFDNKRWRIGPEEPAPPRREPPFPCKQYSYWDDGDALGEVIDREDGTFVYRYAGKRKQGFSRPKFDWLKDFSLESLPVLEYTSDDPDLPWYYPVRYDPEREARYLARKEVAVNMRTGEVREFSREELKKGLPPYFKLLGLIGAEVESLDRRFPDWRSRLPQTPSDALQDVIGEELFGPAFVLDETP